MTASGKRHSWAILFVSVAAARLAMATGPVSHYYLTAGFDSGGGRIFDIQGPNVLFDVPQSPNDSQSPIAVISTIRTAAYEHSGSLSGGEYFLNGAPTGSVYPPVTGLNGFFFDGTTDGTFNYAWEVDTGTAYRFSLTWSNPAVLFSLGVADGRREGITYDASSNSLWIAGSNGTVGNTMEQRSLSGALISSFTIASTLTSALAIDPADGTLWLAETAGPSPTLDLLQYSRQGMLISSLSIPLLVPGTPFAYTVHGGEFAYTGAIIPEPSSTLLGLAGILGFIMAKFVQQRGESVAPRLRMRSEPDDSTVLDAKPNRFCAR